MASSERNSDAAFDAETDARESPVGANGGPRARKLREINLILAESARANLALKAQARQGAAQRAAAPAAKAVKVQPSKTRPSGEPRFRFLQLTDFRRLDPPSTARTQPTGPRLRPEPAPEPAPDRSSAEAEAHGGRDSGEATATPLKVRGFLAKSVAIGRIHSSRLRSRRPHDPAIIEARAAALNENDRQRPILVRPHPVIADTFEIVVGELPYRAALSAGRDRLPVVVCQISDHRALECVLLEEVRRPDLEPMELAVGYGELIRRFRYSLDDLARLTGRSQRAVAQTLLLLDSTKRVQAVSGTATRAARTVRRDAAEVAPKASLNAEVAALERKLSAALGMKVELSAEGQQGNVRISFADLDQLEWIARQLSSQRIRRKGVCPAAKGRRLAA